MKNMRISDLPLPGEALDFYLNSGMTELYPPQAQAIEKGLLEGKNLIAAIPTASGKTLLAEFAMLRSILSEPRGKALYIVPLRALASEKYERFLGFRSLGIRVGISTGDYDRRDERLGFNDIIVATSEKADSLLRNESPWMDEITVVIADEIHLLDSPDRGPTLEVTLAKLMGHVNYQLTGVPTKSEHLSPQIIGLSATIGNAEEVSRWLNAELVLSDWRPVELKEGVFFGNAINFRDGQREVKRSHKDDVVSLVLDTLAEGGQCLLFESSRRNAEGVARRIGEAIDAEGLDTGALSSIASEMRETSEVETVERLASCIEMGSAFHHAGLLSEQRRLVEEGFRENIIKVIASTPTLAAGLNLPARRVIIRGYRRYDPNYGSVPIPVLEYKQMAGRAGRPGLDPYGEAVLIARTYEELEELMKHYILAPVENIWSKLGSENALRTHVLSAIATRYAGDENELIDFMGKTFYGAQQEPWSLKQAMDNVLTFLIDKEMIMDSRGLHPTNLGRLVSRLYIDPSSAAIIVEGLRKLEAKPEKATDITLLHLICKTPDMRLLYLRSREYDWLMDFVSDHNEELLGDYEDYEWFLSEVKTAWVLLDWINEKHEDEITKRFGIGQGDIRALAEIAQWLMHSLSELSYTTNTGFTRHGRELEERITYGASSELLELIQIRGIGRVRARKLYNAGYTNIEKLRRAEVKKIADLIGVKTAQKILKEIGAIEEREVPELEEQRRLGDYR